MGAVIISGIALLLELVIMLVYLDFAIWYSSEIHRIWGLKKKRFRGVGAKFWDWVDKTF